MRYEFYNWAFLQPESTTAAEAAMCAADQDMFWPYHDMLFANPGPHSQSVLNQFAQVLELDTAQFEQCLENGEHSQHVADQLNFGEELGVSSTPTLFVNGTMYRGLLSFEEFEDAIQTELAQAN